MLRIAGLPVWVGPSDVIAGARAVVGWSDEAVQVVASLPGRVSGLLDEADGLVGRITAVADRADVIVGRTDGIMRSVDELLGTVREAVGRVEEVLRDVDALLADVRSAADGARTIVATAGAVTDRARGVVDQAAGAAEGASELLAVYQPIARRAAPLAERFVEEFSEDEVHAAIRLVDQLPQLTEHMERDIMPILATLDRVGPDVHELLEQLKEVRQAIQGIPGLKFFRRRGGREDAEENNLR